MPESFIKATYTATAPDRDPEALAEAIAREQSLELTRSLIPDDIAGRLLGRVLGVECIDERRWALAIGYPAELASERPGQLVQLLYGNVSFYPRVRLTGLALPESLDAAFPGPAGGVAGVRRRIGVDRRALLMGVLKPRGLADDDMAALASRLAGAGVDLIKDDQNLAARTLEEFTTRVRKCTQAIENAIDQRGAGCAYWPHVSGSGEFLLGQLDAVAELGLPGVVMCPWVMGLETAATAAREHDLMWIAHPAGAGAMTEPADHGVDPAIVFGQWPRMAGADLAIYPGAGGRISIQSDDERAICRALTENDGRRKPTLPCTGGGKRLDDTCSIAERLGDDIAIVAGGDLLARGADLGEAVARTRSRLDESADARS